MHLGSTSSALSNTTYLLSRILPRTDIQSRICCPEYCPGQIYRAVKTLKLAAIRNCFHLNCEINHKPDIWRQAEDPTS
jgi:hypothetical protein